jgi:hypothetical protein
MKESKMSILCRQKGRDTVIAKNTEVPLTKVAGNKARRRISVLAMQNTLSLPRIRKKKVLAVRQQLTKSTYDLDKRLDAVVDRLLEAITA